MPKRHPPSTVNQTALGNDNIQVVGSNNVINRITNFFNAGTEAQRARRNRHAMLELVKNTWIKGVLEKSLYKEVLIELGKEELPGAVEHPWDMQVQMPDKKNRTLLSGSSMIQVFDEMNGAMLILGEPGSGKTTMLLELARDCIARAQQDDNQPIPVVFNLSSWDGQQLMDDWLVSELRTKYHVSNEMAENWVANDDLQLLLDGLDEVKKENRSAIVQAINEFRQKHGLIVPIAVCSRTVDYKALTAKLRLQGAVLLQPLTAKQINSYLKYSGAELAPLQKAVKQDAALLDLVKQPLMLNIMILAYQGMPKEILDGINGGTIEAHRKQLFDIYIQQMFERVARTKNDLYTPGQTKHSLAWLAQKMMEYNNIPFFLEKMHLNWLSTRDKGFYKRNIGLISGIPVGLIIGLGVYSLSIGDLILDHRNGLIFGLLLGLGAGLFWGSALASLGKLLWDNQMKSKKYSFSGGCLLFWLAVGLLPLGLSWFFDHELHLIWWLTFGVSIWLIVGAIYWLNMTYLQVIQPYVLRFSLTRNNYFPLRIIPFLDYCVDRVFLRKVGGGYIFVHRLLMEHFADMYPADEK